MAVFDILNANNDLFRIYITWCGILLIKTMLMSCYTVYLRRKNNVSVNIASIKYLSVLWKSMNFVGRLKPRRLLPGQEFWSEISWRYWSVSSRTFERLGKCYSIYNHRTLLHSYWTSRWRNVLALSNHWNHPNLSHHHLCYLSSQTTCTSNSLLLDLHHFTLHGSIICRLLF